VFINSAFPASPPLLLVIDSVADSLFAEISAILFSLCDRFKTTRKVFETSQAVMCDVDVFVGGICVISSQPWLDDLDVFERAIHEW